MKHKNDCQLNTFNEYHSSYYLEVNSELNQYREIVLGICSMDSEKQIECIRIITSKFNTQNFELYFDSIYQHYPLLLQSCNNLLIVKSLDLIVLILDSNNIMEDTVTWIEEIIPSLLELLINSSNPDEISRINRIFSLISMNIILYPNFEDVFIILLKEFKNFKYLNDRRQFVFQIIGDMIENDSIMAFRYNITDWNPILRELANLLESMQEDGVNLIKKLENKVGKEYLNDLVINSNLDRKSVLSDILNLYS